MKILVVTDTYQKSNTDAAALMSEFVQQLRSIGHDVRVLTLSNTSASYKQNYFYYVKNTIFERLTFHEELRVWGPDMIHYQCDSNRLKYIFKFAKSIKTPVVQSLTDASPAVNANADALIVPNKAFAIHLKQEGVRKQLYTLPPGRQLKQFRQPVRMTRLLELRKELNIPRDTTVLLAVGPVTAEKNFEKLIDYMSVSDVQNACFRLVIAGDGDHIKILKEKVKDMNLNTYVRFAGYVVPEDMYLYYKMADIFVSAAPDISMSRTVIEAAACGLPIIARENSCPSRKLTHCYNGYMYTTTDEFINAIEKIQANEHIEKEMSRHSLSIAENFSTERYAQNILNIYMELTAAENLHLGEGAEAAHG